MAVNFKNVLILGKMDEEKRLQALAFLGLKR
jgi:hypothetical protein